MSKKHDFGGMTIDASEPIRISWGGPAFPNTAFTSSRNEQQGMTLRDYFAAKALPMFNGTADFKWAAEKAYEMADAMLKAREA